MEEIAPQKYKGPPAEQIKNENAGQAKAGEIKPVAPVAKIPVEKSTLKKQSQEISQAEASETNQTPAAKPEAVPFPFKGDKALIYFKHNSNELPDESFTMLNQIAEFMIQRPDAYITIKGFTDSTGSYSYNVSVSEFRANTIKTFLVGKGVAAKRIQTYGMGPENPIASNETDAGRRKNRRVEIELAGESIN